MIKNILLLIVLFSFFESCVPVASSPTHSTDNILDELIYYDTVILDADKFMETLNPTAEPMDIETMMRAQYTDEELEEYLSRPFQSRYSLSGCGELKAGKLLRSFNKQQPLATDGSNLILKIGFGGGSRGEHLIKTNMYWDGQVYLDGDTYSTNVVFSFKDLDYHRAGLSQKNVFNMKPILETIRNKGANEVKINLLGCPSPVLMKTLP